jgi:nucleoside-diphosphate-sugar epimerase
MTETLLDEGHEVVGVDRYFFGTNTLESIAHHPAFRLVRSDTRQLREADLWGADVVIDLAGLSNDPCCDLDPGLTHSINVEGACNVARQAKRAGVKRYIYASSCSVYGKGNRGRLDEASDLSPVSEYARSKIAVEQELHQLGNGNGQFATTILRNATVYGYSPRMRLDLVVNLMTLFGWRDGRVYILGGGQQWRPLVHVRDVVDGFLAVMTADVRDVRGQIFNLGSNEQNTQVFRIARLVKKHMPEVELITIPDDADKRNYNVDFTKIQSLLGYRTQRSIEDGVLEIKDALESGLIDYQDERTVTLKYYKYLLDAERLLKEVSLNGCLF